MTQPGGIGVGELIDHGEARMPGQDRIEIHLVERGAAILKLRARHNRHAFEQRLGFLAPVCFDDAYDDLAPLSLFLARSLQHGVGLADAGRHSEKDLQLPALGLSFFPLQPGENLIRIRPLRFAHGTGLGAVMFRLN